MLVDLHSHVLPSMDDGSDSVEMSVAMLRRMGEQGVDTVCATSHYYRRQNGIETFCARRAAALEKLRAVLPEGLPRILPAAEVAYFPHMEEQDLTPLWFTPSGSVSAATTAAVSIGWRSCPLDCRSTQGRCSAGGPAVWRWTCWKEVSSRCWAADCHNLTTRPPNLAKGRAVVRRKLGEDFLKQMDENAGAAVRGWEWSR